MIDLGYLYQKNIYLKIVRLLVQAVTYSGSGINEQATFLYINSNGDNNDQ